jgi:hypothetical protein
MVTTVNVRIFKLSGHSGKVAFPFTSYLYVTIKGNVTVTMFKKIEHKCVALNFLTADQ